MEKKQRPYLDRPSSGVPDLKGKQEYSQQRIWAGVNWDCVINNAWGCDWDKRRGNEWLEHKRHNLSFIQSNKPLEDDHYSVMWCRNPLSMVWPRVAKCFLKMWARAICEKTQCSMQKSLLTSHIFHSSNYGLFWTFGSFELLSHRLSTKSRWTLIIPLSYKRETILYFCLQNLSALQTFGWICKVNFAWKNVHCCENMYLMVMPWYPVMKHNLFYKGYITFRCCKSTYILISCRQMFYIFKFYL